MPTFGFSAFLKLICLNDRPQRTQMRDRLQPSSDAYDFHRSLRLRANRFLVRGESMETIVESIAGIVKAAEQNSVRTGLSALTEWRRQNPGEIIEFPPAMLESPTGSFRVNFTPDFGMLSRGKRTAVHIWNTKRPDFNRRLAVRGHVALPPGLRRDARRARGLWPFSRYETESFINLAAPWTTPVWALQSWPASMPSRRVSAKSSDSPQRRDRPSAPPPAPL